MRTQEVLIVVRRGDDFLVVHRSPENDAYWHQIAGGVENGETFAEAARRELREETGLEAVVQPLEAPFHYESVHVEPFIVDVAPDWEPTLDWEHDDYRWLPRDEAAELLLWPEPAALLRSLP
jgi:8-oxo-dGTP pyrophosphatase MutT (NUDIX family)